MSDECLLINGGRRLLGSVTVYGAKNAVLPLLAAALLTNDEVIVEDCPDIADVRSMLNLLKQLGVSAHRAGRSICVSGSACDMRASDDVCKAMRSSMYMLGALLPTLGEVSMPLPGGCRIGARPLDIHLDGIRKLGARTECADGVLTAYADGLKGADIVMRYPSVGATGNLLMCASLAKGTTRLIGCAREPEIAALARALNAMGGRVSGEGTSVMTIEGVDRLCGATLMPNPDRIVAGTVLAAVAACGGEVSILGADASHMESVISTFECQSLHIRRDAAGIYVNSDGRIPARSVICAPYPLFPTDLQPQLCAALMCATGVSTVTETVFENRFAHLDQLKKLGADITCQPPKAVINGTNALLGAHMSATDLRCGAGLVIGALAADGQSLISGVKYIDRGYEDIEGMFTRLGADIVRYTPVDKPE